MKNINKITLIGALLCMNASIAGRITGSALQAMPSELCGIYNKMADEYYRYYDDGYVMASSLINNFAKFEAALIRCNNVSLNQSSASAGTSPSVASAAAASASSSNTNGNDPKKYLQDLNTLLTEIFGNINSGNVNWEKKACRGHHLKKWFYHYGAARQWYKNCCSTYGNGSGTRVSSGEMTDFHHGWLPIVGLFTYYEPEFSYTHYDNVSACDNYNTYSHSSKTLANYIQHFKAIIKEKMDHIETKKKFDDVKRELIDTQDKLHDTKTEMNRRYVAYEEDKAVFLGQIAGHLKTIEQQSLQIQDIQAERKQDKQDAERMRQQDKQEAERRHEEMKEEMRQTMKEGMQDMKEQMRQDMASFINQIFSQSQQRGRIDTSSRVEEVNDSQVALFGRNNVGANTSDATFSSSSSSSAAAAAAASSPAQRATNESVGASSSAIGASAASSSSSRSAAAAAGASSTESAEQRARRQTLSEPVSETDDCDIEVEYVDAEEMTLTEFRNRERAREAASAVAAAASSSAAAAAASSSSEKNMSAEKTRKKGGWWNL